MKGGLEIFLGVSSLSHGFARALPYSAMERRNWDFFNWFSSNHYEYHREIFLVGSRPTLSEIFLIGSQPNAWSCLIFNVLFSPNWSRRRSTKPVLLYAILRNLKILVLKRRCVLDSFIGTINRHRSSLNNFTPQSQMFSDSFQSFTMPRCLGLNLISRGHLLLTAALYCLSDWRWTS